ncbi:sensor histidine kinase [Williamwhitmania taraxaci]|uniref:histidine kinase n=1 Tax=Williamwhitmania taraxaci TaxID=1640674 RepID=A0A1G6H926_9BACT|nr:HAMP domain-containing sensor histidine kinase [Williamwhitmania taraxaci]SDB90787.1 Signal transduction histidine kinase [Williamwhitmania taraxaci]
METRYFRLILVFLIFPLISIAQEIGFPIIRNYTPKEYKNAPQVMGAIQDSSGVMYFGVGSPTIEYDGVTWQSIQNEKNTTAFDFSMDKNGKIFVAANEEFGYLTKDKEGNTTYQSLTQQIHDTTVKLGTVYSVKLTSKFAYFQTSDAIFQYGFASDDLQIFQADLNGSFSGNFVFQNIYYAQCDNKGLMKIENGVLKPAPQSAFFKNKNIFDIALSYDTTAMLILTRTNGQFLYQPLKDTIPQRNSILHKDFIRNNAISVGSPLGSNCFVLGSLNKGAFLVDKQGTILQQYNESNQLQNNHVRGIAVDNTQNLWIGLSIGISKTEPILDLSYWDKKAGLEDIVESVIRYNGTIYIATHANVYYIGKDNKIYKVQNIPIGINWCLFETKNIKSLLVGTTAGIYEIKGDKAQPIYKGSRTTEIYQSIKNPNRILSTSGDFFISLIYRNGKWIYEGQWSGIKDNIRGIIEDNTGVVWLGTFRSGIIQVTPNFNNITKPQKIKYYDKKDGLVSLKNVLPFRFKNKIIWGSETGLTIYNSQTNRFDPFTEFGEQFCNGSRDVFSLQEMPDGKIWICPLENRNADIGYLQPNQRGGYDWVYAPFRRITDMFLVAFYIEPSGIAWIGGSEGLYRYDMSKDVKNYAQKFNCLIRRITVGTDSLIHIGTISKTEPLKLAYDYNSLKFEFAAPFFDQEEKTLYSYQLIGFDKKWSKWSRQTDKEYTNLGEGTYTFQVKALNIYNVESKTSTFQLTILPPFYYTWWALTLYILLSGLLIFLFIQWRIATLKRQKKYLKLKIREKTALVMQQKEELQVTNEELETINEALTEHRNELEIANATKDKFFSIIAHDLRNPFNALLGISELLVEKIKDRDFESSYKFAQAIHKASSASFELLENLLNWSRSQTGKISFTPEKLDVKDLIDSNIFLMNNSAESKGIHLTSTLSASVIAFADKNMVLTILRNLLTNAIKFSRKDDRIIVEVEETNEGVTIHVSDTGVGMNEETVGKIFKPGEKIKTVGTAKEPGTGLGLILCKEFVHWHHGKIWVESKEDVGSRFSFTLPKKRE